MARDDPRISARNNSAKSRRTNTPPLTSRQLQCLRFIAAGESSAKIAKRLGISADVVNEHVAKACRRLKVHTRTQAVLAASRRGYI